MLKVKIASTTEKIYDGELEQITVKTDAGVLTILPSHVPLITTITEGYVKYKGKTIDVKKGGLNVSGDNTVQIIISN
ncbi:MAG: hypothetical protein ACK5HS_03470 [Mycoplasmatales bacterium]